MTNPLMQFDPKASAATLSYDVPQPTVSWGRRVLGFDIPSNFYSEGLDTGMFAPTIVLVETYRLSSYLGDYGAGRTVKTMSLLPGEELNIQMKTFREIAEVKKEARTILDSHSTDTEDEFNESVKAEESHKVTGSKQEDIAFAASASAGASANWGWAKAHLDVSTSGSTRSQTNSAREDFVSNVTTATKKHVAKASMKREIQIQTSTEVATTEREDSDVQRTIRNINLSRTLNFVFRQLNQEYVTILHLVDARIAFAQAPRPESDSPELAEGYYEEVTLPQLRPRLYELLRHERREEETEPPAALVFDQIVASLQSVINYRGKKRSLISRVPDVAVTVAKDEPRPYWHVDRGVESTFQTEGGHEIKVPGIVLSATSSVLPTDGVVVEAVLGEGEALDSYSRNLQAEAVRERAARNVREELDAQRVRLGNEIVEGKDADGAEIFRVVSGVPKRTQGQGVSAPGVVEARSELEEGNGNGAD